MSEFEGKVVVVTGAGGGLGKSHAMEFARRGAKVVVNDLGGSGDGRGSSDMADVIVEEIRAQGGIAIANKASVSDKAGAKSIIEDAVAEFGTVDILINNAGILRDRMMFSMTEGDWDAVINVHLKGTFAPSHHAASYWREKVKAGGEAFGRIVNTASPSGIYGNVGQSNYGAAKAGIAAFTIITAMELTKYGVTVNCLAPGAYTRMTKDLPGFAGMDEETREKMGPRWIAVTTAWLCSDAAQNVTGRIFDIVGQRVGIAEQWHLGPTAMQTDDPADMTDVIAGLMAEAQLNSNMGGLPTEGPGRPSHSI